MSPAHLRASSGIGGRAAPARCSGRIGLGSAGPQSPGGERISPLYISRSILGASNPGTPQAKPGSGRAGRSQAREPPRPRLLPSPGRRRQESSPSAGRPALRTSSGRAHFLLRSAREPRRRRRPPARSFARHEPRSLSRRAPESRRNAEHQVCGGGGRGGGQDLPAHLLHHQRLPQRVHPHRLRQLQRPEHGGRPDGQPEPLGHGRPGGVRPPAHPLLPADQRLHRLLLHRQPALLRERQAQVVPGGLPPLPRRAHSAGGHQEGPARQPRGREEAQGAGPAARHAAAGGRPGQADPRGQVPGVLSPQPGGHQGGLHRSRPGRPQPGPAQAQEGLPAALKGEAPLPLCPLLMPRRPLPA